MKYLVAAITSLSLATLLSGCMMMGGMGGMGGSDDGHSGGGMMKCGMMMGGMKHDSKAMKHDDKGDMKSDGGAMKCGSDMKMDKNDHAVKGAASQEKDYIITQKYCTQCHGFRDKSLHSANDWKPILARMMSYMQKTGNSVPDTYEATMIDHYYGIQ